MTDLRHHFKELWFNNDFTEKEWEAEIMKEMTQAKMDIKSSVIEEAERLNIEVRE